MKRFFLIFLLLLFPALLFSQEYLTIGNTSSTANNYYSPFNRWYNYSASSVLYTQSELGDAKMLTHIAFDKVSGNTTMTIEDASIYMKHRSSSSLSTPYSYNTSTYTLVWEGDFPNGNATGWHEVELDTYFEYNGTDNIQVLFVKDYQGYASGYPRWRYTSASSQHIYALSDASMPTSINSTYSSKPNVRFQYIAGPDLAVTDVSLPAQPYYAGSHPVSATVEWKEGADAEKFIIHWSVNGEYQGSQTHTETMNESNSRQTFELGNYDFRYANDETDFKQFAVRVWIDNINGEDEDIDPDNNEITKYTIPVLTDIGVAEIVEPRGNVSLGDQDVKVELHNFGAKPVTSAIIRWAVDGINQTAYQWSGTLYSEESVELNIGSYYFSTKVPLAPYVISANTDMPNGSDSDQNKDNDAAPVSTVGPPIVPDVYTIGGADGFQTLEELNAYIGSSGISGEGTYEFILNNGTYSDKLVVIQPSVDKNYRFVFKSASGNPNDVKVRLNSAGSSDRLFEFHNMDNILITGITFELPGTQGTMLEMNNCNNIEILNCVFNKGFDAVVHNYDLGDTRSLKIRNNTFNNVAGHGILQTYGGMKAANYTTVQNNMFRGLNTPITKAIQVTNGSLVKHNNFVDFNNVLRTPANTLITVNGYGENTVVDSNVTTRVTNYNGIHVEGASGGKVIKNRIDINSDADFHAFLVNSSELDANQNLFKIGGAGESAMIAGMYGVLSNNMIVGYDNTALCLDDNSELKVIYNSVQNNAKSNPAVYMDNDKAFVYRNIFSSLNDAPMLATMNCEGATIDENTYYAETANFASFNGQMFGTLEDWQMNSEQDANTNVAKPPFKSSDNLYLIRVVDELIVSNPVDLELTDMQREMYERVDYKNSVRGNQNDYYKGADAVTPDINITGHPRDVITCEGDTTVVLSVSATVTYNAQLLYQWYLDDEPIEGADNVVLEFGKGITYKNSGYYSCAVYVRGGAEPIMSNTSAVYILTEPEIVNHIYNNKTQNMMNRFALTGDVVHLEVETHMRGLTPPFYKDKFQWYFYNDDNGASVMLNNNSPRFNGTKSSVLTIDGVNADDLKEGNYFYVVVEGLCGTVTSGNFNIAEAPEYYVTFNNQPMPQDICEKANTQFTIVAQGSQDVESIEYQWYKNDAPLSNDARISGANTNQLVLTNIITSDAGDYHMVATTVPGNLDFATNKAALTVSPLAVITRDIESDTVLVEIDDYLDISIEADNADDYQWYKDANPIDGEKDAQLNILMDREDLAGEYYCVAINDCGTAKSKTVTVIVTDEGIVSVNNIHNDGYILYDAEPNPVASSTYIRFNTPVSQNAEIFITDTYGNKIASIFNGVTNSGMNRLEINAQELNLSSGVYYYTLVTNQYRLTNKLVIIK